MVCFDLDVVLDYIVLAHMNKNDNMNLIKMIMYA
jgi:hypothetical protein